MGAPVRLGAITAVVLLGLASGASDDCSYIYITGISCYECSTHNNDPFCADPFNQSDHVKTAKCYGACAKWVRRPLDGKEHTIRTCSSKLSLLMPIRFVCMRESRPGIGRLCFCDTPLCNTASRGSVRANALFGSLVGFVAMLFIALHGCGVPRRVADVTTLRGCAVPRSVSDVSMRDVRHRSTALTSDVIRIVSRGSRRNYTTDANAG